MVKELKAICCYKELFMSDVCQHNVLIFITSQSALSVHFWLVGLYILLHCNNNNRQINTKKIRNHNSILADSTAHKQNWSIINNLRLLHVFRFFVLATTKSKQAFFPTTFWGRFCTVITWFNHTLRLWCKSKSKGYVTSMKSSCLNRLVLVKCFHSFLS